MAIFTDAYLRRLQTERRPHTEAEDGERGEGKLVAEVHEDGTVVLWYRYYFDGKERYKKIRRFDSGGKNGVTLKAARTKVRKWKKVRREYGDVNAHLASEKAAADAEARKGTFGDLCNGYIKSLKAAGKLSARVVELAVKKHVESRKALWRMLAKDITATHVTDILAAMAKAGCTTQTNRVRSYLSAAFAWGAGAEHDPREVAREGKAYGLTGNPVALVLRIDEWEVPRKRTLSDYELAEYWRSLDDLPEMQRDCLRFLLALGGQRGAQVLRAPWDAYDFDANLLHLRDPKGCGNVRDHLVPLTDLALAQLELARSINAEAPTPFSSDGESTLRLETLCNAVTAISKRLIKKQRIEGAKRLTEKQKIEGPFQFGDLRRTCETTLARLKVSKQTRAWLLSHGRTSDVQTRHYDMWTYLPEKRAALELWAAHLAEIQKPRKEERGAKVSAIERVSA